jgi:hypothetical protein
MATYEAQQHDSRYALTSSSKAGKRYVDKNASLSKQLHQDRPYLKPIIFVRSTQTPYLFQVQEEILEPMEHEIGEISFISSTTFDLLIILTI